MAYSSSVIDVIVLERDKSESVFLIHDLIYKLYRRMPEQYFPCLKWNLAQGLPFSPSMSHGYIDLLDFAQHQCLLF